jgi:hypothetical protein
MCVYLSSTFKHTLHAYMERFTEYGYHTET